MAWTSPNTATAGTTITAANHNTYIRDNLKALLPLDIVAFTSYTPTLTQSSAVTKTVTYAKYQQFGKFVICNVVLTASGAGTGNAKVTVSLPVTAAANQQAIGSGFIVDASVPNNNPGIAILDSTTTVAFVDATQATGAVRLGQTGAVFSAALASSDVVSFCISYEAA
jgi:hypothetical protein